ncbi:MAG: aminotransferase class I/II-fold pyridoxal phosphate-dependent enzyme [Calditrichae bacterium]|nr:aminotransferase class I/II-fold pyridoxal phosphate-dependent enzyme [Calditrichota bacterium]MCB9059099.1 aminotransferase class I/II-fold pyridoxal phosphate-dependent enzyme [Calditrichia bacterium]
MSKKKSKHNHKNYKIATLCVHGSGGYDPATGSVGKPIYQTSTFAFENAKAGADIFLGEREGYVYTRISNPTQAAFESEMAFLEKGEAALAFSSGMAAISGVIFALCKSGDNFVSSDTLYGGSHELFAETLPRWQIQAREVNAVNPENISKAIDKKTRLIYIETPANPTMSVIDIEACADIARKNKIPLVVDNTFSTPYFQQPLTLGASVVLHSATKYIGGHGDTIAGVVVSSKEFIDNLRMGILRDLGGVISPLNAWLLVRGLKTLAVRMEKHQENAFQVAKYLQFHPKIAKVMYPGLTTHPQYLIARKQMRGFGGMISFEVKGGRKAGEKLMDSVKLITLAVSLGDVDSLIEHPASMTHSTYAKHELEAVGITENLVRLSVGIEDPADLIDDLSQALNKIK